MACEIVCTTCRASTDHDQWGDIISSRLNERLTQDSQEMAAVSLVWQASWGRLEGAGKGTRYELSLVGMQQHGVDRPPALVLLLSIGRPDVEDLDGAVF